MRLTFFVIAVFFGLTAGLFGPSCANIVPPNGGPRDSMPPRLLSANPKDSALNFRSPQIVFTFDEYVDLQDVPNNLIFSPLFAQNPRVEVKGKTITVNFRDTLEPNTTYIFNFGNAIRDYNEGNVLKGFTYTFSTGAALDSLELSGRVVLAQSGRTDSTLTVLLHRNLTDSAVVSQKPQYAVRVDGQGNFRFRNLPAGRFALYALGNAGSQRRYVNKRDLFAFADSAVEVRPGRDTAKPVVLYAYSEEATPVSGATAGAPARAANRLTFALNQQGGQQELDTTLQITFATPLRSYDSAQLLLTDSLFQTTAYTTRLDSTRSRLTLRTAWQPGMRYHLILNRDFAMDTAGRRLLKSDTLQFTARRTSDYGSLSVRLKSVDSTQNPVLQLVQNNQVVLSASLRLGRYQQALLKPGDYEVRLLNDRNGNGVWDAGRFPSPRRQPEVVRLVEQKFTVKPGVENVLELADSLLR